MHERYISYDASRKKYRVELRISKGKSVSKRVDTLEEARELRGRWLKEREALAQQPASEQNREEPTPTTKPAQKKRAVFYDSDPEDDRNIPRMHLRRDYPAEAEDAFTVVFD
jgi:plasmid stabilization system protein ParE